MALSLEEVQHIAELAKLALTDEEKALMSEQLSDILDYVEMLQAVDTEDVAPTYTVLPVDTVLRDDAARPSMPRDKLLANASKQDDGMFEVEVILE
jgi:aspartyl-tRNA(Asn)/glutamyl-tRNA(Gln) amidotransferase subunit C